MTINSVKSIIVFLENNKAFSFSCFVATSLYFFSGIFFGIDFTDSFYHLNQALNPADGIYLYPFFLSSLLIKWMVGVAGPEIIFLRIINSTLLYFSILMPFFINKVEANKLKLLNFISLVLILFAPFNVNILGYDTLSIFILSLIFSLTILYFKKKQIYLIFILSILSAAAVLIRIPNILVVPILIIAIGLIEKVRSGTFSGKTLIPPLVFFLLTTLCIFFGYFWYYPNFEVFFQASANATSHNLENLLHHYLVDGVQLVIYLFFILGGFLLIKKLKVRVPVVLLYGLLGVIFFLLLSTFVALTKYSQKYSFLLTALAISFSIIQVLKNKRDMLHYKNLVLYLFIIFLFINPFGSDTGLLKATSLVVLLPFVLSAVNFRINSYWFFVWIIIIPFSILENFYKSYEDQKILVLDQRLKLDLLDPIHTNKTRSEFLINVDLEIKKLEEENIQAFFYGDKSHVFHYLYPETDLNINSFFQPVQDLIYYPKMMQAIKQKKRVAIFLVDSYPENIKKEETFFDIKLIENGFEKITKGKIEYFVRLK